MSEIKPLPDLPIGVLEAAQRGTLIPFIGAGVSRLAGCPSWIELADEALKHFVNEGKFTYGQLAQIAHLNPRVKLSIAKGLQDENIRLDFKNILERDKWDEHENGNRLYQSLAKLGRIFVTTNYDNWLHKSFPTLSINAEDDVANKLQTKRFIHRVEDLSPADLSIPNTVIHLHGSVEDPDQMILTTQDYVRHYANDRKIGNGGDGENKVLTFLDYLFSPSANKTVLFVGYGLEELEILEYVILKARRLPGTVTSASHYLLQGFYSHQEQLMKSLSKYFLEECGIQLIPFSLDQKNWEQLIDVLEDYSTRAPASGPLVLQQFAEMEALLHA